MPPETGDTNRSAGRSARNKQKINPVPLGENHLLVIGIDEYQHCPKLFNAVKDAKDFVEVMTSKYQFTQEKTTLILDEAATQDNIISALEALALRVDEKDRVLIYFSGHGEYKSLLDIGYWIPVDGELGKIGSFISFHLIKSVIKVIKSHHTFVIADSCYSGSFFTTSRSTRLNNRLEKDASRWLMTAGRNEVVSDGKPGDNSPFADSILYYLKNNTDPRIAVSELCQKVKNNVGENYDQVPEFAALKGVGDKGGEFMFRLKEYANHVFEEDVKAEENSRKRSVIEALENEEKKDIPKPKPKKKQAITSLEELHKQLKQLTATDDFERAFDLLHKFIRSDSRLERNIILTQGRLSGLQREYDSGVMTQERYGIEKSKLRNAVYSIIEKLDEDEVDNSQFEAVPASTREAGNDFSETLDNLEKEGLQKQAETLQEKINFYKAQIDLISDIAQKFTAQKQLKALEEELAAVKHKLGI